MKKTIRFCVLLLLVAAACEKAPFAGPDQKINYDDGAGLEHGMIQLGEKLEDPYSVENMTKALRSLYPTKADVVRLPATNHYVRLLPRNDDDLTLLENMGVTMLDHPLDYQIVREGDWYHDPEIPEGELTWQYAVVPVDFSAPDGIRCELLHDCYLAEEDLGTKSDGIDWAAVERESFRLTGNSDLLPPATKGDSETPKYPKGRIAVYDSDYDEDPVGVAGVMVCCNVFVRIAKAYTDEEGYYEMEKSFTSDPRYRIQFTNRKGFSIGFNAVFVKGSISTLGKHSAEGYNLAISPETDTNLFRRSVINNAAYDYFDLCRQKGSTLAAPPSNLRIWQFGFLDGSATLMMQQGAIVDFELIDEILGEFAPLVRFFLPDIVLGLYNQNDYASIYSNAMHELSHTSHYMKVGNEYWDRYALHILTSWVSSGGMLYGVGTEDYAGYCEVGEMWGYYMQNILYRERYADWSYTYGLKWWFRPEIFLYLDERGLNRDKIFAVLSADVHSRETLQQRLLSLYPEFKSIIYEAFNLYN